MNTEEKNQLYDIASQWEQIAMKCDAIAARHRAKGERLQAIEQAAFATGRRACVDQLRAFASAQIAKGPKQETPQ